MKYFVFVDESGNNAQEEFFALGALFISSESIGEYYNDLNKVRSKILTQVKHKEQELEKSLKELIIISQQLKPDMVVDIDGMLVNVQYYFKKFINTKKIFTH